MKKWLLIPILLLSAASHADPFIEPGVAKDIGDLFQGFWCKRPKNPTAQGIGSQKERAVFLKTQGCAKAKFVVEDLPAPFRVGVFAQPNVYDALVRISSDTIPRTPDQSKSTIGFAVKVLGEQEQDFLTQNHPVFFVDNARDFRDFTKASLGGKFDEYAATHPQTAQILNDMDHLVDNVLSQTFHSTVPSRLGQGFVKYRVVPCIVWPQEGIPETVDQNQTEESSGQVGADDNYLQKRLVRDLQNKGTCFHLQVLLRDERHNKMSDDQDPEPLDRATKEWEEKNVRVQTVATILIEPQDINVNAQTCEHKSFTAWHSLPEHEPVGSVQEARKIVYDRMAKARKDPNACAARP